jgi:hypothetical protein
LHPHLDRCQNHPRVTESGQIAKRGSAWVLLALVAVVGATLFLSSCAAGPNPEAGTGQDPAGFWLGLWQGIIVLVTFVISLFSDNVNVYEVVNNGNWYDFGFVLGLLIALGGSGGGAGARARRRG